MGIKRMLHLALTTIMLLLLAYVALVAFIYVQQEHMVYFPERSLSRTPADQGVAYEDVWLETSDGVRLHGWFILAESSRGTLLYFHGNGGNIATVLDHARLFHQMNLDVLLVDYRGYGQSEGTPNEEGTYRDAAAAWSYLVEERQVAPESLVFFGGSLGGGVASWLAQQHTPAALILEATFTTLPDVGQQHYPILPVKILSRNRYPTIKRLPDITCPLLVIHSRDDEVIPYSHGQRLFAAAQEPKTFMEARSGHNGYFLSPRYRNEVEAFIDSVLEPAATNPAV